MMNDRVQDSLIDTVGVLLDLDAADTLTLSVGK